MPPSLPRLESSHITYAGHFRIPSLPDPITFNYGGHAMSVSTNGEQMYLAGLRPAGKVGLISIPAIGGMAGVVANPQIVPVNTAQIPNARIGGTLPWVDRVIITAYSDYGEPMTRSHCYFRGGTFSNWSQPAGGVQPGRVAGSMCLIPEVWRADFGGPALTGLWGVNIVGRSNYGFGAAVFNPDHVGATLVAMREVIAYPDEARALADGRAVPTAPGYWNFTVWGGGGLCFPVGTRTVFFVGRVGTTKPCYGTTAICDNTGGNPHQGFHGAPYEARVWAYDALELLNGSAPWEKRPYASWPVPELAGAIMGAAYCHVRRRLYVTEDYGSDPRVRVFDVTIPGAEPPPPPPPPPPVLPPTITVRLEVSGTAYHGEVSKESSATSREGER